MRPSPTAPTPQPVATTIGPGVFGGYAQKVDLDAIFSREIEPVRVAPGYIVAMAVVAFVMLLLPLVYLGMLAGLGYGVYAYVAWVLEQATGGTPGRPGRVSGLVMLFFMIPAVIGVVVLLFMVKPLFAPSGRSPDPEPVLEEHEPVFYEYVRRLCRHMGAPVPRDIMADCDVNASAGFRHGVLSFFWSDLRLTIGLPLVASMTVRELTGVLAHEFGHFSQRAAMRFSHLIRTMNIWFMRLAYERDIWDLWLVHLSREGAGWVRLLAHGAILCVWVSRLAMRAMCHIAGLVSGVLSRAMEYNADLYEIRVAGSEAFMSTCRKLHDIPQAISAAHDELLNRPDPERVPDNLPVLYVAALNRIPTEQLDKSFNIEAARVVGVFDTHPSFEQRARAAAELADPGIVALDAPASILFKDFPALCCKATYTHLHHMLGRRVAHLNFAPVKEFLETHTQTEKSLTALAAIVGPEVIKTFSIRPMFLRTDKLETPDDPGVLPARWNKARQAMAQHRAQADAAARALRAADDAVDRAVQAECLRRAGVRFDPKAYGLSKATIQLAQAARDEGLAARGRAEYALEPFEKAYRTRVATALQLLAIKGIEAKIPNAREMRKEVNALLAVSVTLRHSFAPIYELSRRILAAQAVLAKSTRDRPGMTGELDRLTGEMNHTLRTAHAELSGTRYPFGHPDDSTTIAHFYLPRLPEETDGPAVLGASTSLRDGYQAVTRRVLARIAEIALEVEEAIRPARDQG